MQDPSPRIRSGASPREERGMHGKRINMRESARREAKEAPNLGGFDPSSKSRLQPTKGLRRTLLAGEEVAD